MALKTRKILISAIYDKVGKLSIRSVTETNSGKLIKLATSEVLNVEKHLAVVPFCFAAPPTFIAIYGLIWLIAGWLCALIIFGIWLLVLAAIMLTVRATSKAQSTQAIHSIERMKLVTDMVVGIQTIKAYALEKFFAAKVKD